jgi:hypothetical protein
VSGSPLVHGRCNSVDEAAHAIAAGDYANRGINVTAFSRQSSGDNILSLSAHRLWSRSSRQSRFQTQFCRHVACAAAVWNGNQSYISEDDEELKVEAVGFRIHGKRGAWRDALPKPWADGGVDGDEKVGLEMRFRFRLRRLRLSFKPYATRGRLLIREKNGWLAARSSLTVSSWLSRIELVTLLAISRIRLRPLGVQALTAAAARPPTATTPST